MKARIGYSLVILALAVAACSSTAKQAKKVDDEIIPTESPTISDTGTAVPSITPSGTTSPAAPIIGGGAAGRPAGPKPIPPGAIDKYGPPSKHGITSKTIKIGFWFINTDTGCQVTGVDPDQHCNNDDVAQINALTTYVNRHGGIAGRTLISKIYETKISDGAYQAMAQSACDGMVNDDDVFAGVSEGQVGRPFMTTCLKNAGRIVIDPGTWPYDNVLSKQLSPYLYQPSRARPERWVRSYIDGLAAQGFFSPGAKIGLIRFDAEPFDRVTEKVLKPRLKAHGVNLNTNLVEAEISTPPALSGYGPAASQLNNTILRFQNDHVTHVIFFGTLGEIEVFWFNQAHAAGYHPRYGLSSNDYFRSSSEEDPANFTARGGAVGVAWMPYFDMTTPNQIAPTASTKICADILKTVAITDGAGRKTHCDGVFFLKAVLDRAPVLNVKAFRATVDALNNSFIPASVFGTHFNAGRHDGPSILRYVKYVTACSCFKYYGPARPFP
jgi:hypothetical protein